MVAAAIQFTQGVTSPGAGIAMIGVAGTPVNVKNGNDTGVTSETIELLFAEPTSSVPRGVKYTGDPQTSPPNVNFTPDVGGTYLWHIHTSDGTTSADDFRAFSVPEPSGRIVPGAGCTGNAMNAAGNVDGWNAYVNPYLRLVDALAASPGGVGTVALLASTIKPPATGSAAIAVAGYATAVDGGGGVFGWAPGDTTTANGITVVASTVVGAPAGRWRRVFSGELDPRWAGAVGDGTTDDTAALTAVDALGPIRLPPGTWRIASNLTINHQVSFEDGAVVAPDTSVALTLAKRPDAAPLQRIFAGLGTCTVEQGKISLHWLQLASDGAEIGPALTKVASNQIAFLGGVSVTHEPGSWTLSDQPTPIWNWSGNPYWLDWEGPYSLGVITLLGGGRQRLFCGNQHGRLHLIGLVFFGSGSGATVDCSNIIQAGNSFEQEVDIEAHGVLCSVAGFGQFRFQGTGPARLRFTTAGCGVNNGSSNGGKVNVLGYEGGMDIRHIDLVHAPLTPVAKYTGTEAALYLGAEESTGAADGTGYHIHDCWWGETAKYGVQVDPISGTFGRLVFANCYWSGAQQEAFTGHDIDVAEFNDCYWRLSGTAPSIVMGANCKDLHLRNPRLDTEGLVQAAVSMRNVTVHGGQGGVFDIENAELFEYDGGTPAESLFLTDESVIPFGFAVTLRNVRRSRLRNVVCDTSGPNSDGAGFNVISLDPNCVDVEVDDCTFAAIDISLGAPQHLAIKQGGQRWDLWSTAGTDLRCETQQVGNVPNASGAGATTTLGSIWVPPGASTVVDAKVQGYPLNSPGTVAGAFRRRQVGTYSNVGGVATADAYVAPAPSNPVEDLFAVCSVPYQSSGSLPSLMQMTPGAVTPDRVSVQVVNKAPGAMPFNLKALLDIYFPGFHPSMFSSPLPLSSMLELLIDESSFAGTDGSAATGVVDRSGKNRTVTIASAPIYRASIGPDAGPALDFGSGGQLTVAGLPALKNLSILAFGSFGSAATQCLCAVSDSASAWDAGGALLGLQTFTGQPEVVCQRNGDSLISGNGVSLVTGTYHTYMGTAFRGVDGTQPYGARAWMDGTPSATVQQNLVTMANNTHASIGQLQGGTQQYGGVLKFLAIFSQAFQS